MNILTDISLSTYWSNMYLENHDTERILVNNTYWFLISHWNLPKTRLSRVNNSGPFPVYHAFSIALFCIEIFVTLPLVMLMISELRNISKKGENPALSANQSQIPLNTCNYMLNNRYTVNHSLRNWKPSMMHFSYIFSVFHTIPTYWFTPLVTLKSILFFMCWKQLVF